MREKPCGDVGESANMRLSIDWSCWCCWSLDGLCSVRMLRFSSVLIFWLNEDTSFDAIIHDWMLYIFI